MAKLLVMSRPANPFVLHTLAGIVCLIAVMLLLPEGTALWRRILAGIFSITLGHQIGVALTCARPGRAGYISAWLECLAFPLLILAVLKIPDLPGWILAAAGVLWRPLVARLWKKPAQRS